MVETLLRGTSIPLLVFVCITCIVLFFLLGVITGNVFVMLILAKFGVLPYSGVLKKDYKLLKYLNKDGVGWLHVPDTCYSPIMLSNKGYYNNHTLLNKQSRYGELYLTDGKSAMDLQNIAKKSDNIFKDLSTIRGTAVSRVNTIRGCKFTNLKKYVKSDLKNRYPDIELMENGRVRIFNLLFAVEISLEDKQQVKFTDRDSFLISMRRLAYLDTGRRTANDIIILSGNTEIDTHLVFLVEKG